MTNPRKDPLRVHIRWMIRRDMPEVLTCETGWDEEDFLRQLRRRECIGMVAEVGEKVVGFMVYELHKDHLKLLNLGVLPKYRRRRIGTQLINRLAEKLSSHRRYFIDVHVHEEALECQLFLRSLNFKALPVPGEDYYLFQFGLSNMTANTEWEELLEGDYHPTNRIAQYLTPEEGE